MPFRIKKTGSKYQVVTSDTGKVHGTFGSKAAAMRQLRALYARVPEARKKR